MIFYQKKMKYSKREGINIVQMGRGQKEVRKPMQQGIHLE
jgi:hypothetical protein